MDWIDQLRRAKRHGFILGFILGVVVVDPIIVLLLITAGVACVARL